jgi:molybdopterin-guanine dinucleotide biosynthesis protein MobB
MPTVDTARVYPGACLVEGTNLSEGRGTTRPFEIIGAPWLHADAAADAANGLGMAGVVFRPHAFRPTFQKQAGLLCGGVQAHVTDLGTFRPFETYLRLIQSLRNLDPGSFAWRTEVYEYRDDVPAIDLLAGTSRYRELVDRGESLDEWIASFADDLARFAPSRERSLIYPKQTTPPALVVTGAHESGKTTLSVRLIEALVKEGVRVGALKHTDHEYETDQPGKDSQRHHASGAEPALLVAGRRSAAHRKRAGRAPLAAYLPEFLDCDVVVVEGFRSEPLPKIEVCRTATGRAPVVLEDPYVVAVVTDRETPHPPSVPRFSFDDFDRLFALAKRTLGLAS